MVSVQFAIYELQDITDIANFAFRENSAAISMLVKGYTQVSRSK